MPDSILTSTKKILGLSETFVAFDPDVITHLNASLSVLSQIGVGPDGGIFVEDKETTWAELGLPGNQLAQTKTYIYLKVRSLFDPPPTSFAIAAMEKQLDQFEWRLKEMAEGARHAANQP